MSAGSSSFVQIPSELLTDPAITALDLRIYCILMDFGFKGRGFSQIGHKHLGKLVGVCPGTIARRLKHLTHAGYISVTRTGLNRNDKIRCLKTVRRSEHSRPIKNKHPRSVPHLIDRKLKTNRSRSLDLEPTKTSMKPSKTLTDTHQQARTKEAIELHSERTKTLLSRLRDDLRPQSFRSWFEDTFVASETEDHVEICTPKGPYAASWIRENLTDELAQLTEIAGKEVVVVATEHF